MPVRVISSGLTCALFLIFASLFCRSSSSRADEEDSKQVVARLDRTAQQLPAVYGHDFRTGLPRESFLLLADDRNSGIRDTGLQAIHEEGHGLSGLYLCRQLKGDFDVEATFSNLELTGQADAGYCGIGLGVFLDNASYEYVAVVRRNHMRIPDRKVTFSHGTLQASGGRSWQETHRNDPVVSGRFRLARRGNIIYGLYADDSGDFQLLQKTEVKDGHVGVQGLRLVTESGRSLKADVVWNQLKIRASEFRGGPVRDSREVLAKLKAAANERSELRIDLADPDKANQYFQFDRIAQTAREHNNDGLQLLLVSGTGEKSAHVTTELKNARDFDIAADLMVHQLETPDARDPQSEIGMQVFLAHQAPSGISLPDEVAIFLRPDYGGSLSLVAQCVSLTGNRKQYRIIRSIPAENVKRLRIALLDDRVVFICRHQQADTDVVFADLELPSPVTATSVDLYSSAKGRGYVTGITWQSLSVIHAESE